MSRTLTVLSTAIAVVLLALPASAAGNGEGRFVDDNGSVHEGSINALAEAEITAGCNPPASDRYCPYDTLTRAQAASFLVRALDVASTSVDYFVDDTGSIHENSINALAEAGITVGCNPPTNNRYCPDETLTRAQAASLLARALELPPADRDYFADDDGSVHESTINAMAAAGVTVGCNPPGNDRYCPNDTLTRAQAASFLTRGLGIASVLNVLDLRSGLRCVKDGLLCTDRLELASGTVLEVVEGWYQVVPYLAGEEAAFMSSSTTFTLTYDAASVERSFQGVEVGSRTAEKTWRSVLPRLTTGTHSVVGRWRWQGETTRTVVFTLVVR